MDPAAHSFINLIKNPVKSRLFLVAKLPSAFFSGVRVKEVDEKKCIVTVPYKWFSKNPFRSTYFACLSMAAEMSTGVLCMAHIYKRKPPVSMLVIKMEAEYFKKATGKTTFTCEDGAAIEETVASSINSNEAQTIRARSTGKNNNGDVVAEFYITWSFKIKNKISS